MIAKRLCEFRRTYWTEPCGDSGGFSLVLSTASRIHYVPITNYGEWKLALRYRWLRGIRWSLVLSCFRTSAWRRSILFDGVLSVCIGVCSKLLMRKIIITRPMLTSFSSHTSNIETPITASTHGNFTPSVPIQEESKVGRNLERCQITFRKAF